jgi:hypothetical protein
MRHIIGMGAAIALAGALAGCAGVPPPLPDPRDTLISVVAVPTPDNILQYMIPHSQVFVTGTNFARGALAGREEALVIRLDHIVVDRLRAANMGGVLTDTPSEVALIPKARLVREGDTAALVCTLEAQYSAGGMADSFVHRKYTYSDPRPRKLVDDGDGWTDNEGALFQRSARAGMEKLADQFIADWRRESRARGTTGS